MSNSTRWLLPDGVDELLPSQARSLEKVRREILDQFDLHGFEMIQPPLIEFTDSLLIGLGEDVARQSMFLTDQVSGRPMAIRADVSSQAARIDAHRMPSDGVNRLCYVEPIVFAQPKQQGSSRCPLMAGAEVFGCDRIETDIDVILLMLNTLRLAEQSIAQNSDHAAVEPLSLTLDVGHVGIRRLLLSLLEEQRVSGEVSDQLFDALQRKSLPDLESLLLEIDLPENVKVFIKRLPSLSGDASLLDQVHDDLRLLGDEALSIVAQLKTVANVIQACLPEVRIYCDFSESRGYSYHTGLVFAVYCDRAGEALANGGRYDGVGKVFGRDRAATGFNTDLKVLNRILGGESLASNGEAAIAAPHIENQSLWEAVSRLRKEGRRVVSVAESELLIYSQRLELVDGEWSVVSKR